MVVNTESVNLWTTYICRVKDSENFITKIQALIINSQDRKQGAINLILTRKQIRNNHFSYKRKVNH